MSADRVVVIVDVDGVIYNFISEFRNTVMLLTGRRAYDLPDPTEWDFYKAWKLTTAEFQDLFIRSVLEHNLLRAGMPMPTAVAGWLRLRALSGVLLHIVSDAGCNGCRERAEQNRTYWLHSWGFVPDALTYTADKAGIVRQYRDDGWTVLGIEDNVDNYRSMSDAGAEMWLAHHPFNSELVVPTGRRVNNFEHFALRVESSIRYR